MRVYRGAPFPSIGPCVLTIGNFDGLHLGHRNMLVRLKREALQRDLPAAVLTFEPHPRELFQPANAPTRLTSLREKLEALREAGIDRVYITRFDRSFAAMSAQDFIRDVLGKQIGANYVLVGEDFCFGQGRQGRARTLVDTGAQHGFAADIVADITLDGVRCSSTVVREALADGNLSKAAALLGRPYSISGRVVHGNKLGREIGFPTANVQLKHNRPPVAGIFAVQVHGLGPLRWGAASIGTRPTVDQSGRVSLEVHLLDFDADVYGRHLRIDFMHKLRDEVKYDDLDSLIEQIQRDVVQTREFFAALEQAPRISSPHP